MIKIEKGFPMPPSGSGRPVYPLRDMHIGDSFSVPFAGAKKALSACRQFGRRTGVKYASRRQGDCLRIWRIA